MPEQIIEVDKHNNIIGLRSRDDFYTGKYIHRASHLILFNSKNKILLQQRSPHKKWYPNLFCYSVSGTVADESYDECMSKEMKEEIGIMIPVEKLFVFPYFDTYDKAFHAIYLGRSDKKIQPDKSEIEKVTWIDAENLREDIRKNKKKYTPNFVEGMNIFYKKYYEHSKNNYRLSR